MGEKILGVIGGSGLYDIEGLRDLAPVRVETPFWEPSEEYLCGFIDDTKVVFLPRHGKGHRILPSELNFRANIYGMKKLGVEWIIAVSAVGSMKEEIHPGEIVIPDQFFDRTKGRPSTFFGEGVVGHVSFADPICPHLSGLLYEAGVELGIPMHRGGTYICIEGPQFSTRAESLIYRQWGVDVIGMTNIPEAKLAREAEICYATIALATDYDCWHQEEEDVSIESVLKIIRENVANAKKIIKAVVSRLPESRSCPCPTTLEQAIITNSKFIPQKVKDDLDPIIGKYVKK